MRKKLETEVDVHYVIVWIGTVILASAVLGVILVCGIGISLQADANPEHSMLLDQALDDLRVENCEYYAVFSGSLRVYETTDFNEAKVSFPRSVKLLVDLVTIGEKTIVHNHPGIPEASFSLGDLRNLYGDRQIVVTERYNFILEAPQGWPTPEQIDEFLEKYWNYDVFRMVNDELLVVTDSAPYKDGFIVSAWSTSKLIEALAAEYGMIYTVEEVNGLTKTLKR